MGKRLPQLYYMKVKISYDLGFITMPVNNEDAYLQTQNLGGKLVIFEALFKSLLCFQCS